MKKINVSFYILLLLLIQVFFADTIIYFTNIKYEVASIIASVINIVLAIYCIKKKYIKIEIHFNKWDIIFITILLLLICTTIIFPDTFWDSYSYHIYLQENPFTDKVNTDMFPGRTLTSFVFPIADRVFYMFRALLGFRLGTLPGYLLLVVIFYECKKILKVLLKDKIKDKYLSILSILPIFTFIVMQQIGTYYIDNFSVVMILEFVYVLIAESKGILKNKPQLYYLALIAGISVCIKITNVIYLALPLVYVLLANIKDIKQIKWYDYILLIITAVLPMLPYLLDAIIQTGSPVFPYYNTIFKSEYYAQENWLDRRYGPKNIIQFLLWPIYITKHPEKAYEFGLTDFAFPFGYIILGLYTIYAIYIKIIKKQKLNETMLVYCTTLLYLYLVWPKFVIGYTRYAGAIAILSMLLMIKTLIEAVRNQKIITCIILSSAICLSTGVGVCQYLYYGTTYNYSLIVQGNLGINKNVKQNIKNIYKDKEIVKYDIEGIWGVIYDDSAVPMFLNVDDRLVHLEYGFKTGNSIKSEEIYWQNILNNDIYVPLYKLKLEGKLQYLDRFHFEIVEITDKIENVKFLEGDSTIYIVKVKYNESISSKNKEIFEKMLNEKY